MESAEKEEEVCVAESLLSAFCEEQATKIMAVEMKANSICLIIRMKLTSKPSIGVFKVGKNTNRTSRRFKFEQEIDEITFKIRAHENSHF